MKTLLSLLFAFFSAISFGQINAQVGISEPVSKVVKLQPKIRIIDGSFYANLKSDKINVSAIQSNLNEWLGLSAEHTFIEFSTKKDDLGITHQNFQQFYKGILIDGSAVMLHAKDGIANSINGMISNVESFEIRSSITAAVAKNKAMTALNATKLINEYPIEMVIIKHTTERSSETKLAFKVRIDASDPIQMVEVFVDANSGKILQKINLIAHADEPGTGLTVYRGQKAITVDNHEGAFRLRDAARNIQTYDATGATFANNIGFQNYNDFTNSTSNYSLVNPAVDAHWGMEKTYDFYMTTFNRNSYDNLGSPIKNFVNGTMVTSNTQNNAFAYPPPYNFMVYGLGNGTTFGAWVGLDVVGHEFTHMIIQHNGNGGLTYQGQSGALNESFADIFGTAVEFYTDPNANWTVTEGVVLTAPFYLRSLSNPNSGLTPQPDTYQGTHWINPNSSSDYGGVHRNSGVQNFWFYLLCQGGTGTNDFGYTYNVASIGMEKALKIAYRSLNNYLPTASTFSQARNGSLQATEDLYGATSAEYAAVVEAWNAVNVVGAPPALCSGTTTLTASTGTFSDNSGDLNYENYGNCKWLIAPAGAQQITLNFSNFKTELNYDFVRVYDGPNADSPLLGTFSGNTVPSAISTSVGVGAMFLKFTTDDSVNFAGWDASYTSIGASTCTENATFTSDTGSFTDGSGTNNYGNNQNCRWLIAPTCAETVVLSFTQLETELNFDKILVYDDAAATNLIATVSGTVLPANITSSTGVMVVHFKTDYRNPMQGFTANYTSTENSSGVLPTFTAVAPICVGGTILPLPTTSTNGITGTWLPTLNNNATTIYTFTPDEDGFCQAIMTIIVHPIVIPTFTSVPPICSGAPVTALPTTSLNGITGSWTPALNNTTTTTYTFTPTVGQCATSKTMVITVNPIVTTTFTAVAPLCSGTTLSVLPSTSTNGIAGNWSPAFNNTASTTYTFTPNAGQCGTNTTMSITINPTVTPTFTPVAAFCSESSLTALPTSSLNGITGLWSPALNDTITTTYTFVPTTGQCATNATMTIPVNSSIMPTFSAFAPICSGTTLPALPLSSLNGIAGSWSPVLNNSATTSYTFTPAAGQCASSTTMTITVNPIVTPTFTQVNPISSGGTLANLPTTSINGITGTWSPVLNNTATTLYTFTPNSGQCASNGFMTIIVNSGSIPLFTQVNPICSGATLAALPTTSTNGITGTWSPALNNTATTLYTFTSNEGQDASSATMTITVNAKVTPTFTQVNSICSGAPLAALPTTSTNGISGTWSPEVNNTATTLYTFTPESGQCASNATMTITVNPIVTPTFTQVNPISSGGTLANLPTTSINGIAGTWSPALNNTATTLYTFTPNAGQCASVVTMTITVNSIVTPTFTQVDPICSGATLTALPTTSTNGITGNWSPALNNSVTTLYTFTPNAGQNASNATMTITVNAKVTPTFTQVNSICSGATLAALPSTSTNGISGTWSPEVNNTATTFYTFTPESGQCASVTTMTITVNPIVTPTFTQVNPISTGGTLANLPTTSINGIAGTWSPALNNTTTTLYTFTPNAGQCASVVTMTITVNSIMTPTFAQIDSICSGATLAALPSTSTNGITGNWWPALNNSATTLYTFTPNAGQNASSATMTITVNAIPETPTIAATVGTCSTNAMLVVTNFNSALTYTSLPQGALVNNSGIVSSAVPGTEYTFTASNASCTSNSSQPITLLPQTSQTGLPTLSAITAAPVCAGNTTTIVLSGLLTNTYGTATYKIGNGAPLTTSGTTTASGTFSFQTPVLPAQANGIVIEVLKIATALGCETIFTGKTVTLIVTPRPTLTTVTAAPACIGGKTNIVLAGLLPNTLGIATYKIGNGSLLTQTGTSTANGLFIFQTPTLPAAANGLVIEITKISYANGCETIFTGKKVTLVVQNCNSKENSTGVTGNQNSTLSASNFGEEGFEKITLYPNPTSDVLNIDTNAIIESVEIFNMQGQKVITSKQKQITVSQLQDGVYLLRIKDSNNNVSTKKFIKKL